MVKTCCVKNCNVGPKEATLFNFPTSRLLKRQWIDAIGLTSKLSANSSICSRHFQADDYDVVRGKPRLRARVVPTVFGTKDKDPSSSENTDAEDEVTDLKTKEPVDGNNVPKNSVPEYNVPEKSVPENNAPEKSVPENNAPEKSGPETSVSENNAPVKSVPENSVPESNAPENNEPEEIKDAKQKKGKEIKVVEENKEEIKDVEQKEKRVTRRSNKGIAKRKKKSLSDSKKIDQGNGDTKDGVKKLEEDRESGEVNENGVNGTPDVTTNGQDVNSSSSPQSKQVDLTEDIEEIITNYQIKQTRPLHNTDSRVAENRIEIESKGDKAEDRVGDRVEDREVIEILDDGKDDGEQTPVFIEVAIPEKDSDRAGSPRDCLMVLESVQVDVDPSSLLAGEGDADEHETVQLDDDEDERPVDPISLLTSSDEDEVIIQEPHIDTVEVSDETDEDDDLPLVRLLKKHRKTKKTKKTKKTSKGITSKQLAKFMWGMAEFYCVQCHFTTTSRAEFRSHAAKHSTILQVCQVCDYTSASKSQFARHKRKHKDDKRFKCHLCDYKARHNMSLIYHLKSHDCANLSSAKKGYKCDKCGFKSDVKSQVLKHVRLCSTNVKKYSCDKCSYESKRPSDLSRHVERRHREGVGEDTP